ncbi:MAG: hypothetical protein ACTSYK_04445 [Alphaproteobacteria bacterium]
MGHTLDLLVAGIVCTLLFVATYSQRRTWIALGSAALSVALLAGSVFLATAQNSTPIRDGVSRLAEAVPAGWDRHALNAAVALERASSYVASARRQATERESDPVLATSAPSIAAWFFWRSWFPAKPNTEESSVPTAETVAAAPAEPVAAPAAPWAFDAAIQFLLDAPPPLASGEFALRGANVSDQPLKLVRAVLKPDSSEQTLKLTLDVEGGSKGDVMVPPGAQFSLSASEFTAGDAAQLGGAILSVAYVQAGRRKSSITYLTQTMLAQRIALD